MSGFARHPEARLETPDVPGLAALCAALEAGAGIEAGPSGIASRPGPQRLFLQSSGSTGAPKRLIRRPESWLASFAQNAALFGLGPGARIGALGDLRHSLGLYAALEALHLGAALTLLGGQSAGAQIRAMDGLDLLYATPTQLRLALRAAPEGQGPKHILCGGGRLDPGLRAALRARFAASEIREFYGSAEASFIALSDGKTPPGAAGRAYPGVQIEAGRAEAPAPIRVRSPYLFEGYEGAPPHRGPVATGEIGFLDAAGYLTVLGRVDRRVRIAESWVHPEALEARLAALAPDQLAAVLARPDPMRGARLVAVLEGAEDAALGARVRVGVQDLPSALRPVAVHFLPRMPLLPAGKPDYAALAAALSERGA